jgi:hypothetical protein
VELAFGELEARSGSAVHARGIAESFAPGGRLPDNERRWVSTQDLTVMPMGDKSPKAKEKSKKQDTADKNQKKAAAFAKAAAPSPGTAKKK